VGHNKFGFIRQRLHPGRARASSGRTNDSSASADPLRSNHAGKSKERQEPAVVDHRFTKPSGMMMHAGPASLLAGRKMHNRGARGEDRRATSVTT
jgi:hypothetical protein